MRSTSTTTTCRPWPTSTRRWRTEPRSSTTKRPAIAGSSGRWIRAASTSNSPRPRWWSSSTHVSSGCCRRPWSRGPLPLATIRRTTSRPCGPPPRSHTSCGTRSRRHSISSPRRFVRSLPRSVAASAPRPTSTARRSWLRTWLASWRDRYAGWPRAAKITWPRSTDATSAIACDSPPTATARYWQPTSRFSPTAGRPTPASRRSFRR